MKSFVLFVAAFFVTVSSLYAFDGKRDQWVIGAGMGYAPIDKVEIGHWSNTRGGIAFQLLVGPALDERNLLVAEANVSFMGSNWTLFSETPSRRQGFVGLNWFHYYGSYASSFSTSFGLGIAYLKFSSDSPNSPGLAYQVGSGYALAGGHVQIGLYLSSGSSSNDGGNFTQTQLTSLLSFIGF